MGYTETDTTITVLQSGSGSGYLHPYNSYDTFTEKTFYWKQIFPGTVPTETYPPLTFNRDTSDNNVYKLKVDESPTSIVYVSFTTTSNETTRIKLGFEQYYRWETASDQHPFDRYSDFNTAFIEKYNVHPGHRIAQSHSSYDILQPEYILIVPKNVIRVEFVKHWQIFTSENWPYYPYLRLKFDALEAYNFDFTNIQFNDEILGIVSNSSELYLKNDILYTNLSIRISYNRSNTIIFDDINYTFSFVYIIDGTSYEFSDSSSYLNTSIKSSTTGTLSFSFNISHFQNSSGTIYLQNFKINNIPDLVFNLSKSFNYKFYKRINFEQNTEQKFIAEADCLFLKQLTDGSYNIYMQVINGITSITFTYILISVFGSNDNFATQTEIFTSVSTDFNFSNTQQPLTINLASSVLNYSTYKIQLDFTSGLSKYIDFEIININKQLIQSVTYSNYNISINFNKVINLPFNLNYTITNSMINKHIRSTLISLPTLYTIPSYQYQKYVWNGENLFEFNLADSQNIIDQQYTVSLNIDDIISEINCNLQ